jgi:hypothetical protein
MAGFKIPVPNCSFHRSSVIHYSWVTLQYKIFLDTNTRSWYSFKQRVLLLICYNGLLVNVIHTAWAEAYLCLTVSYCWHPAVLSHILTVTVTQQQNDYVQAFIQCGLLLIGYKVWWKFNCCAQVIIIYSSRCPSN